MFGDGFPFFVHHPLGVPVVGGDEEDAASLLARPLYLSYSHIWRRQVGSGDEGIHTCVFPFSFPELHVVCVKSETLYRLCYILFVYALKTDDHVLHFNLDTLFILAVSTTRFRGQRQTNNTECIKRGGKLDVRQVGIVNVKTEVSFAHRLQRRRPPQLRRHRCDPPCPAEQSYT